MQTGTQGDSVMAYLQADHERLDGLIETARTSAHGGDMDSAARHFSEFRDGLLRHIRIEEEMVFPEFERATDLDPASGPTGVMRHEHVEITRLLDLIHDLFSGPRPGAEAFERLHGTLVPLLQEHNAKEERILYPMTDRMVAPPRLKDLVNRMRAFR